MDVLFFVATVEEKGGGSGEGEMHSKEVGHCGGGLNEPRSLQLLARGQRRWMLLRLLVGSSTWLDGNVNVAWNQQRSRQWLCNL